MCVWYRVAIIKFIQLTISIKCTEKQNVDWIYKYEIERNLRIYFETFIFIDVFRS